MTAISGEGVEHTVGLAAAAKEGRHRPLVAPPAAPVTRLAAPVTRLAAPLKPCLAAPRLAAVACDGLRRGPDPLPTFPPRPARKGECSSADGPTN